MLGVSVTGTAKATLGFVRRSKGSAWPGHAGRSKGIAEQGDPERWSGAETPGSAKVWRCEAAHGKGEAQLGCTPQSKG